MPDDHTHASDAPPPKRLPVWPEGVRCESCAAWIPPDGDPKVVKGLCSLLMDNEHPAVDIVGVGAEDNCGGVIHTIASFACNQWKEKP